MRDYPRARSAAIWVLTVIGMALCAVLELFSVAIGGTAPPVWFWTAWSAVVTGCLLLLKRRSRYTADWAFVVCAAVFPVAVSLWEWDSRKAFTRDLARVELGMTVQEADRRMGRWIRGSGAPPNPFGAGEVNVAGGGSYQAAADAKELAIEGCKIFRHAETGNYDADWGIICFADGRVASVEFAPD